MFDRDKWQDSMVYPQPTRKELRDTFAAAALTGLLSNVQRYQNEPLTRQAYEIADFMLRERSVTEPMPKEKRAEVSYTNHDAAPAARADSRPLGNPVASAVTGTGDTPATHTTPTHGSVRGKGSVPCSRTENKPVAWIAVFDGDDADGEFVWPNAGLAREWASTRPGVEIAPLYLQPQPTLTDEEREAVERACDLIDNKTCGDSTTLRKLLERLK